VTPKACGETETAIFNAPSSKHPITLGAKASLFLADVYSWQAVTNTLETTLPTTTSK